MKRNALCLVWMSMLVLPGVAVALDLDEDGFEDVWDCNDHDPDVNPDANEVCNGRDDNCDGTIDEGLDVDGDGYTSCGGDCDEVNADINPGAGEVCDGVDNDCDGAIDEGYDADGDGYSACDDPGDCNDANADVNPDAEEVCNLRDDDCNGEIDEGLDCPTGMPDDLGEQGLMGGGCNCSTAPSPSAAPLAGALALTGLLAVRRRS